VLGIYTGYGLLATALVASTTVACLAWRVRDYPRGRRGLVLTAVAALLVIANIAAALVGDRVPAGLAVGGEAALLAAALLVMSGAFLVWPLFPLQLAEPLRSDLIDPLTRTATHRAFQDRLGHECDRAYRFGDSFALIIIDLDQFRHINNRHGHKTGDRVLGELASRIGVLVREIDLCARFAGDQFAIILPHTLQRSAADTAERIRKTVAAWTFDAGEDHDLRLTASLGISVYPADGADAPVLVEAAERALKVAKSLGGNQVQTHHELPSVHAPSAESGTPSAATVVRSLAAAVDVRDRYTHSHSRSVSDIAAAVAQQLGLPGLEVNRIRVGALLHDVGKIGVPDSILSKEGSLTPGEWESIRQHPVLGKTIIEQAPELHDVIPLVLHHQERYDGTGYPSHLRGMDIPLGARIIAAADAYHAIRSNRPYRRGRTHREAVPELRRCSGSQFDPEVVDALVAALEADDGLRTPVASLLPSVTEVSLKTAGHSPALN